MMQTVGSWEGKVHLMSDGTELKISSNSVLVINHLVTS